MQIALTVLQINIAITDNGLDAADVGILNIQAGSFTNTGVLEADLNLNVKILIILKEELNATILKTYSTVRDVKNFISY